MAIRTLQAQADLQRYHQWLAIHPKSTLWQSLEWKAYQETLGRETRLYASEDGGRIIASALVIIDRTVFGLSTWDIPRGPLGTATDDGTLEMPSMDMILETIVRDAHRERCMALYLSPLFPLQATCPTAGKLQASFRHIQPSATIVIDLTQPEDAILAEMHPKGRYNIKVAQKHGVRIEESQDSEAFCALAAKTAGRDGFRLPPQRQYEAFLALPGSFLLLAYAAAMPTKPIAGLIGVTWGSAGIFYYGASSYEYRALMAPYLLQWEAMKRCKAAGCQFYDLLGIAPAEAGSDHPWRRINAFKSKFGGRYVEYPQEREIIMRPWRKAMLQWKRAIVG